MTLKNPAQLPFALPVDPAFRREDLIESPANRTAIKMIDAWPNWPGAVLLLTGPSGAGKTHLASIWAERASAKVYAAGELGTRASEILEAISDGDCIVIEDVSLQTLDQNTLFHIFNAVKQESVQCLLTSSERPANWDIGLKDLESRLRAVQSVELGPPDDDLLRMVMVKLFADRQIAVNPKVIETCLLRMERSLGFAGKLVDRIDREALAAGAPVSRQLASRILDQINQESDEGDV